jgi:hypothetical protein
MDNTTDKPTPPAGSQPLKNSRHEIFCQEVCTGSARIDAYIEAYPGAEEWKPRSVRVKAAELGAREDVKARIGYLQAKAAEVSVFTLAAHLARLNELSIAAQKAGDFAPAVKAEENRGKAAGFYPTKVELTGKGGGPIESKQTRDLTPEELRAELAKHGIEP